jgi:hypothetical protein
MRGVFGDDDGDDRVMYGDGDGDGDGGHMYGKSRALDDVAAALTRRFISLRADEELLASAAAAAGIVPPPPPPQPPVGTADGYCSPRRRTHFEPSFGELSGVLLWRGEHYLCQALRLPSSLPLVQQRLNRRSWN